MLREVFSSIVVVTLTFALTRGIEPFVSNQVITSRRTRTAVATKAALRSLFIQSGAMRSPRTLPTSLSTEIGNHEITHCNRLSVMQ
jgi:hypothetical protein